MDIAEAVTFHKNLEDLHQILTLTRGGYISQKFGRSASNFDSLTRSGYISQKSGRSASTFDSLTTGIDISQKYGRSVSTFHFPTTGNETSQNEKIRQICVNVES